MSVDRNRTSYADLVRAVSEAERIALVDVRRIVDATVRVLNERVNDGGEVVVGRLGTFRGSVTEHSSRLSFRRSTVNPKKLTPCGYDSSE